MGAWVPWEIQDQGKTTALKCVKSRNMVTLLSTVGVGIVMVRHFTTLVPASSLDAFLPSNATRSVQWEIIRLMLRFVWPFQSEGHWLRMHFMAICAFLIGAPE